MITSPFETGQTIYQVNPTNRRGLGLVASEFTLTEDPVTRELGWWLTATPPIAVAVQSGDYKKFYPSPSAAIAGYGQDLRDIIASCELRAERAAASLTELETLKET